MRRLHGDGRRHRDLFLHDADPRVRGRKITTIEGIEARTASCIRCRQAFVEELGPQCGF